MKIKKLLMIFVFFALLLVGSLNAQFGGGSGTEANPYRIYTKSHMGELADSVENSSSNNSITGTNWSKNKYFLLMNDITDSVRKMIGGFRNPYICFQGTFDGNNKKITLAIQEKNLCVDVGLFTQTMFSYIHNLIVDGYVIYEKNTNLSCGYTGSIVGLNDRDGKISYCINRSNIISSSVCTGGVVGHNEGIVSNCYNFGNIIHRGDLDIAIVGGIAGHNYGLIDNSQNSGNIIGTTFVGGIVGLLEGYTSEISYCINIGTVEANSIVGGIVGSCDNTYRSTYNSVNSGLVIGKDIVGGIMGRCFGEVKNCLNTGAVKGNTKWGCIVGENDGGTIINCYYDKQVCGGGE